MGGELNREALVRLIDALSDERFEDLHVLDGKGESIVQARLYRAGQIGPEMYHVIFPGNGVRLAAARLVRGLLKETAKPPIDGDQDRATVAAEGMLAAMRGVEALRAKIVELIADQFADWQVNRAAGDVGFGKMIARGLADDVGLGIDNIAKDVAEEVIKRHGAKV